MIFNRSLLPFFIAARCGCGVGNAQAPSRHIRRLPRESKTGKYEVWASDQSNSESDQATSGSKGSFIWIWDSDSIQDQLAGRGDASPLGCSPNQSTGPCDLLDVFPQDLVAQDGTQATLRDLPGFGRLHAMIADPTKRYVAANIFTPTGGFVGVIDTATKEAIGLFRVAGTEGTGAGRSVHMSIWTKDGTAILIANLHGKMIERIDVQWRGTEITNLELNKSASVYLGKNFTLVEEPTHFEGTNSFGRNLIGNVVGSYTNAGEMSLLFLLLVQFHYF